MNYILDRSKWVNGDTLERGTTLMLNADGYQCCLGQFAAQKINIDLFGLTEPYAVAYEIQHLYDPAFVRMDGDEDYDNTELAEHLIQYNDSPIHSGQREELIRKALEDAGHTLTLIN